MKILFFCVASVLALLNSSVCQEEEGIIGAGVILAPNREVEIPGRIADCSPSPPMAKPEPLDFTVKSTVTHRMKVVEAPEMAGLPAVKGTITATVHLVEDPGLTDPPPPLPSLPPDDPAVLARMAEMRSEHPETELVFLSATVFDHRRTLLRWYPKGDMEREMSAWSNLDFNHFSGFAVYRVAESDGTIREFGLLMGIGDSDSRRLKERMEKMGHVYQEPGIPELPDLETHGPAFLVVEGDTTDREAVEIIEGMHSLYKTEGPRMKVAYLARTKAYEERKAYLLANPRVPDDVTIHFWKRSRSVEKADGAQNMEGTR